MGQLENNLKNTYVNNLSRWQRLWRVNSGFAWAGEVINKTREIITLRNYRVFRGVDKGVADNIGFDSIIITPDMVGKRVAVFVATEIKATKNDKLKPAQVNFKNLVVNMGGIHREVREDGRVVETKEF